MDYLYFGAYRLSSKAQTVKALLLREEKKSFRDV